MWYREFGSGDEAGDELDDASGWDGITVKQATAGGDWIPLSIPYLVGAMPLVCPPLVSRGGGRGGSR